MTIFVVRAKAGDDTATNAAASVAATPACTSVRPNAGAVRERDAVVALDMVSSSTVRAGSLPSRAGQTMWVR